MMKVTYFLTLGQSTSIVELSFGQWNFILGGHLFWWLILN